MRMLCLWFSMLAASALFAEPGTKVYLNGALTPVFFNDGDSFRVLKGPLTGTKTRIAGFNTLESYGIAHQWDTFDPKELFFIAKKATLNAREGTWHCHSDLKTDGYGRTLWHCPDLAKDQIGKGFAHVMTVDEKPGDKELIKIQKQAQQKKVGMWAHGVPKYILTSAHSADERPFNLENFDRYVSTVDGHSEKVKHHEIYQDCQKICDSPDKDDKNLSCLIYVNFKRRFGQARPKCLR